MKYVAILIMILLNPHPAKEKGKAILSRQALYDKVKGGWYGQVIGALAAESEGTSRSYTTPAAASINSDLLLLRVFKEHGIAASRKNFTDEILTTTLPLSHAFKIARWNLEHGHRPPHSGNWTNNPHADDHDFLLSADLLGLMSPGLPGEALSLSDHIGHVTNGGDGFYGGLFVATLYSLAFTEPDYQTSLVHALNTIPARSKFSIVLNDCLDKIAQYPDDWKKAAGYFNSKWKYDLHCPDGGEEIRDSKLHAAFLTMGLMYGKGDMAQTFKILSELHADPTVFASAGGILGTLRGFEAFTQPWKDHLQELENEKLPFSSFSLQEAVEATVALAYENIEDNGGRLKDNEVIISLQKTPLAKLEKSFEGHCNKETRDLHDMVVRNNFDFEFEGVGFVVRGILPYDGSIPPRTIRAELYLNNKYIEDISFVPDHQPKKADLIWKLQLPYKKYKASIRLLDPSEQNTFKVSGVTVYDVPLN